MADPLVSIIVNNHNYGRFLGAAIDSAQAQQYTPLEVVVVDDGSTDGSREIIAGYGDRIQAVYQENGGQGAAFNAGFAASHGAVVDFLDADDLLYPDAASRAVAALADSVLVQWLAPLDMVDAAGQPIGAVTPSVPMASGDLRDRVVAWGPWAYPVTPSTGNFWPRHYLEQVLPMPAERYRLGADEYLSAIAPFYGRLAATDRPAGCYRAHGANNYWRPRLTLRDVADDAGYFERISALLVEHAGRQGLAVNPHQWLERDWRQQVRRRLLHRRGASSPGAGDLLGALRHDQTRPWKKAALAPLLVLLAVLPPRPATALGLGLLVRR